MIKYLRDKITGRPAVFSPADDLSLDDNIPPMKKTHSQNSLNDVMSISINSNLNDITSSDQTISQVEKLTATGGGNRLIYSSSPIIIPKKPTRSNASSQSSSSYTSIADQMSLLGETSLQTYRELDDASYTSLPMLSSTCQQLEHSAARDRILVKNKRRQPIKAKLSTLRETDDNQIDLFSSTVDDEQVIESKIQQQQQQPVVNLSDLDTARERLRVSVRPRDHSADNILSTTPIVPTYISSIQRSISFKRPQELNEIKLNNRSIFKIEKNEEEENKNESKSHSFSSKEHIYDNLDLFKRHKINIKSDITSNENDLSNNNIVKSREQSIPINTRLRPVTMHASTNNDKQITNEFESVFNQLKKRASIKRVQSKDEIIFKSEERIQSPISSVPVEDTSINLLTENEPIIPVVIPTNKIVEITSVPKSPNRRRTVGGVGLIANNKVAVDDNKPTPSWIDIAKQKQTKFQSVSIEKHPQEESEQQITSIEPVVVSKKQVLISSNVAIIKENTSDDSRSNRKSMFEPIITRRISPPITPTNTHVIERDSIRALKAGNPNRINNLIQFFDK